MSKIQSKRELVYDSRTQKKAIIQVEVVGWKYNPQEGIYYVSIGDYVLENISGVQARRFIGSKESIYSREQINGLFTQINNPINATDNFSDKLDDLISNALLAVTTQQPIYGSEADDWEML